MLQTKIVTRETLELSNKTYCATKGQYYYGVKMHTVAKKVTKKLPLIDFISITKASENDFTAFRPILERMFNNLSLQTKDIPIYL